MRYIVTLALGATIAAHGVAQNNGWVPLGPWELVERLDNVQIVKVLRAGDLTPALFPPKPAWQPSDGGDFFPASDVLLYRRMPASTGQQQYFAYESYNVVLDDANIRRIFDTSGQGRFRISRVEIAVYFPFAGIYEIQGFWTGSDDDLPPYPTSDPNTFLRSNQGPHTLFVPQAGVWRMATNTDPLNEVFTVQCGELDESLDSQRRFNCYVGLRVDPPGAWVCGALPGTDLNLDYFLEHDGQEYHGYQLQGGVPATFALQLGGAAAPLGTQLQGTLTINGYTGSYAGKQATIKVKQGPTINTYTVTLDANGGYSLRVDETGNAEVWVKLAPGLAKKVSLNLNGTVTQDFNLTNGDVNNDNVVDDADLLTVLFNFGGNDAASDVNGDNVVDDADLLTVLFNFGSAGDGL